MAVVKVRKMRGDSVQQDSSGLRIPFHYTIQVDSQSTKPYDLLGATDGTLTVPVYGESYGSGGLVVTSVAIDHDPASPVLFDAKGEYSVPPAGSGETPPADKNDKYNKQVRASGVEYVDKVNSDVNGDALRNPNNVVYPAEFEVQKYDQEIVVSFDIDPTGLPAVAEAIDACRGKINDASVSFNLNGYSRTFPEGTLRLGNASWDATVASGGVQAFHVEMPFVHRSQLDDFTDDEMGWAYQQVCKGMQYKDSTGRLAPDKPGTQEYFLYLTGERIPDGTPVDLQWFDLIEKVSFDDLLSGV